MKLYNTVVKEASAEQEIEKSRFIAHVKPVETKEEADAFITSIKKQFKDATHNVPAMVLGDKFQIQWGSDDGEPQGTSGAPIVQTLVKEGITNVVIVVTRYFGGVKLGTGGLVRAYTSSAKLGLEAASICEVVESTILLYRLDYSYLSKIENLGKNGLFTIEDIGYDDKINVKLSCMPESAEEVEAALANLTSGNGILIEKSQALVKR